MSKKSIQKRLKPQTGATEINETAKKLGFKDVTGNWKSELQQIPSFMPLLIGRVVVESEDTVEAILHVSENAQITTCGGLLVMNYIRGAGYNEVQNWDIERVYRRLRTLDSASRDARATVEKVESETLLNRYGRTSAILVKSQIKAQDLLPEVSRFNGFRAEIPGSPKELDLSIALARIENISDQDAVLSAINDTLPKSIVLGPLALLHKD